MRTRGYIKDAIMDILPEGGALSRDLAGPVSRATNKDVSKIRVSKYMEVLEGERRVRKERVYDDDGRFVCWRWFPVGELPIRRRD